MQFMVPVSLINSNNLFVDSLKLFIPYFVLSFLNLLPDGLCLQRPPLQQELEAATADILAFVLILKECFHNSVCFLLEIPGRESG